MFYQTNLDVSNAIVGTSKIITMKGNTISEEFNIQHTYLYEKSLLSVENQSVEAYQWNDTDKKMTAQKLRNGMIFTVCVT